MRLMAANCGLLLRLLVLLLWLWLLLRLLLPLLLLLLLLQLLMLLLFANAAYLLCLYEWHGAVPEFCGCGDVIFNLA